MGQGAAGVPPLSTSDAHRYVLIDDGSSWKAGVDR